MKEQVSAHCGSRTAAVAARTVKQFSIVKPMVIECRKGGFLGGLRRGCMRDVFLFCFFFPMQCPPFNSKYFAMLYLQS